MSETVAATTIWDLRIQCICGLVTADSPWGTEVFFSANFAQVSDDPLRIAINPNRVYPIDEAIKHSGKFAINVMSEEQLSLAVAANKIRRRQKNKADVLNIDVSNKHDIPYLKDSLRTVFCEVEKDFDTGDHRLVVAKVLESQQHYKAEPLIYHQVLSALQDSIFAKLHSLLHKSGFISLLKKIKGRSNVAVNNNIQENTFYQGGYTEDEISSIKQNSLLDNQRIIKPPLTPAILKKQMAICVVGTSWGLTHLQNIRTANPKVKLFICGNNEEKTARIAKKFGAEDYLIGYESAIKDPRIQGLVLALPHHMHKDAAINALSAGKHVLVEKPIARTLKEADVMIAASKQSDSILMVAENMHFRPSILKAVSLIEQGYLGEPLYFLANAGGILRRQGWVADKSKMGGGVLIDIGVHYIRALRLLMGEPDSVFASRAMQINTKMDGEDSLQLMFSSKLGWDAHMLLSWSSLRGNVPDIIVAGEKGTLHLWPTENYLDFYTSEQHPYNVLMSNVRPYWLQNKLMRPSLQHRHIKLPMRDDAGYLLEMREFMNAINEQREPVTSAEDARRDLEIVLAGYEALEKDKRINLSMASS